ncbi:unnamed protein product [Amoebophrya sp. A25]|nr:unnamed protein product [Amoebophrya sp. A25]|eukprot:GSA25T00015249001.1
MMAYNSLLEKMGDWDKDQRFMAASDVTNQLLEFPQPLDGPLQKRISTAFLKQLEDASIEVQGNAVKCLAKVVCKFQEPLIGDAAGKLAGLLIDGEAKVRDIYATCLKALLLELNPAMSTAVVCQQVLPRILAGILSAGSPPEVKEECVDVLCEVLRRFGDNSRIQADRVTQGLLNLLQSPATKLSLRKKTTVCIGILSTVLLERQLDVLLRTLLELVNGAKSSSDRMIFIQCISTIARNAPGRAFSPHAHTVIPLLLQICREATGPNAEDAPDSSETVEYCLSAFEAFAGKLKELGEAQYFEPVLELVLALIKFDPNFYGHEDDVDMEDEADQDYEFEDDSGDDDESWKVRRAAYKLASALVIGMPQRLGDVYDRFAPACIGRFAAERDPNVKVDAFHAMEALARAAAGTAPLGHVLGQKGGQGGSAVSGANSQSGSGLANLGGGSTGSRQVSREVAGQFAPRPRSPTETRTGAGLVMGAEGASSGSLSASGSNGSVRGRASLGGVAVQTDKLVALMPTLVGALAKQLTGKSRVAAFSVLKSLAQLLPTQLEPPLLETPSAAASFLGGLQDTTHSIVLDTLAILKALVANFSKATIYRQLAPTVVPRLLQICRSSALQKAIAESFKVLSGLMYALRAQATHGATAEVERMLTAQVQPLFAILQEKMTKTDLDQDVKEATLECLGHTLASMADIFDEETQKCLPPFVERMRNELTRSTAMSAFKTMCASPYTVQIPNEMLHTLCTFLTSYLSQNQRVLRQQSLDCLGHVLRKYPNLPEKTQLLAVSATSAFFTDTDLYLTDLAVQVLINALKSPVGTSVAISEVIAQRCLPGILHCTRSPLLQGGALNSILEFFSEISYHSENRNLNLKSLFQQLMDVQSLRDSEKLTTAAAVRTVIANIAKCIAALAIVSQGIDTLIQDFASVLGPASSPEQPPPDLLSVELALLSLGEMGKFVDLSKQATATPVAELFLAHLERTDSDDVAHAAALALGFATMGAREVFLPLLLSRIESQADASGKQQYLLLTGFREILSLEQERRGGSDYLSPQHSGSYTNGTAAMIVDAGNKTALVQPHMEKIAAVLESQAESNEEGVRGIVAECLGHLMLIEKESAVRLLEKMIASSESPRVRSCAVGAIKYAAGAKSSLAEEPLIGLMPTFIKSLEDDDVLQVRRATLQSILTLLTSNGGRLAHLLAENVTYISQRCVEEGKINPSFVREVDLGPFKHKVDDGLVVRKVAFSVMNAVITVFGEKLVPAAQEGLLLGFLSVGFADSDDVQQLCCNLIADTCTNFWLSSTLSIEKMFEPLDRNISKNSKVVAQKGKEMQKASDMLRAYARLLKILGGPDAGPSSFKPFQDFVVRTLKDPIFAQAYNTA